ncbi:MAG: isochorismatase family protein [Fimbriimonas sp.]
MARIKLQSDDSVVILVDLQTRFLAAIHESGRVRERALFIAQVAKVLGVPVLATEQVPDRMGGLEESFVETLSWPPFAKSSFSCLGSREFADVLAGSGRRQVILVGIETHICVSQTAHDLLDLGLSVVVCPDAVSSRSLDRHKLGMERLRDADVIPIHAEAVAYEWMKSAEHPKFREVLGLVKELGVGS